MHNSDRATKGRFRWHWDRRQHESSHSTTGEQNTLTHLLLSFATQGCTDTRPGILIDNRQTSSPLTSRPSRVDRKADAEQVFLIIVQSASPPRHAAAPDKFTSKPLASFHGVTVPSEGEHQKGGRRRGDCGKPCKGQLSGKAYATHAHSHCQGKWRMKIGRYHRGAPPAQTRSAGPPATIYRSRPC